jgi:hypothetical protein
VLFVQSRTNALAVAHRQNKDRAAIARDICFQRQSGPSREGAGDPRWIQLGAPKQGQTLTATPTIGSDGDGGTIQFQWQSSTDGLHWSNIPNNANTSTYLVQQSDGGHELRVQATFTDDTGQSVTSDSSATARVAAMTANPERFVISEGAEFVPITTDLLANDSSPFGPVHVTSVDGHTSGQVQLAPGYIASLLPDGHGGDLVFLSVDDNVVHSGLSAVDVSFTYTASDGTHSATATDTIAAVNIPAGGIDLTSSLIGQRSCRRRAHAQQSIFAGAPAALP